MVHPEDKNKTINRSSECKDMQINYQKGAIVGMNDSNFRIEDGGRVTYFDIIDYTKSHLFR